MPIRHVTAKSDASSESESSIFHIQERSEALESLMKNFNDDIDDAMDDMEQDSNLGVDHELFNGEDEDDKSALSVSQLGNQLDTAQIVQLDRDLATIRTRIVVLEDPSISTRPDVIKQQYEMIAGLAARRVELVNSIRLRLAIASNKPQQLQEQAEQKESEQEHTADQRSVAPELPVQSIVPPDEIQSYDRYGNPLSTQGLPLTSWNITQGVNGSTMNPRQQPNANNGGGHPGDDDNGDDDDDGYHGYSGRRQSRKRNQKHQRRPTKSPHENYDQGKDSQENAFRRQQVSLTLYYPPSIKFPMANRVAWLSNSIDGPYEGKLD
jgi:hypothetical protein